MTKYIVKNNPLAVNGRVYKRGVEIELDADKAKAFGDDLEIVKTTKLSNNNELSRNEIIKELKKLKVDFKGNAKTSELLEILKKARKESGEEEDDEETEENDKKKLSDFEKGE